LRVAIVGSGIAGLGCAWLLARQGCRVTLFEANDYAGGHTHTVDVTLDGITAPVDTGFLVFNDRTYPKLVALFSELGIASAPSAMSFSVRDDLAGIEWSGGELRGLFAHAGTATRPAFWRMIRDILRFNRETSALHRAGRIPEVTLGEYLDAAAYSRALRDWYLAPMAAAIWSSSTHEVLEFPLPAFVCFCYRHGLLQLSDRPQWRTVVGGARTYVDRIVSRLPDVRLSAPVRRVRRRGGAVDVDTDAASGERFDEVVLACHSDQALALLRDPSLDENRELASIHYQPNRVLLHTDIRFMPQRRRAWAAWNYLGVDHGHCPVCVTYWINKLQPVPFRTPLLITLNPPFAPRREALIEEFEYSHPMVKGCTAHANDRFARLQGKHHTWYAGAWLGDGFHEDGLASAHAVAQGIAARRMGAAPALAAA